MIDYRNERPATAGEVARGLRVIGIVALRIVAVIAALVALATVIVGGLPQ